jgi:peptidoglycan hydrolase CwlO-like protein
MPEAPADFKFMRDGLSISVVQEKFVTAVDFMPICSIVADISHAGKGKDVDLVQKLLEVQKENQRLQETLEVVQKELEDTKRELNEKDELFNLLKSKLSEKRNVTGRRDADEEYVELQ